MLITSHFNTIFKKSMLPECAWYCKDTYATNFSINFEIINNEMMILICIICRYIMLHQFISSRRLKICVKYLRMISRMKAASIFYFLYTFQEICIINMYFIIHGPVIIHVLPLVDHEGHIIQLVIIAIQSSLYVNVTSFAYIIL